jgi:hypothetical protein
LADLREEVTDLKDESPTRLMKEATTTPEIVVGGDRPVWQWFVH